MAFGQPDSPLSPNGRDGDGFGNQIYGVDSSKRHTFDSLASPSTVSGSFSYPMGSPRSTILSPNEKTTFLPHSTPITPATPTIKHWPTEPKALKRNNLKSWNFWYEIIRILCSLAFVAFGIIAFAYRERDFDNCAPCQGILKVCEFLPTAFPIVYTALTGASLQHIALALAVKGTRLVSIEQLLQYNSVGAAIMTPFKMSVFDKMSSILLLLWAFSPIGGQGGLRMLQTYNATSEVPNDSSVAYYVRSNATTLFVNTEDPTATNYEFYNRGMELDPLQYFGVPIDNLFRASLFSTLGRDRRSFARDNLGHVRIPLLSSLESIPDGEGWLRIPTDARNRGGILYSSFLGVPITTNTKNKRSRLSLETSYFEFNCFEDRKIKDRALPYDDIPQLYFNVSTSSTKRDYSKPLQVLVQSVAFGDAYTYQVECTITEPRVQVNITCEPDELFDISKMALEDATGAGNCEVESMRHSRQPSPYEALGPAATFLDSFAGFYDLLFDNFPLVGRFEFRNVSIHGPVQSMQDYTNKFTLPELYLFNPSNIAAWGKESDIYGVFTRQDKSFDPASVGLQDFQSRMSVLFNSFVQAIQSPGVRTLNIPVNGTAYAAFDKDGKLVPTPEQQRNTDRMGGKLSLLTTYLRETRERNMAVTKNTQLLVNEQYRIRPIFFSLYIMSSVALLVSVLVSIGFVIKFIGRMAAPDVLGFFSSFTRDNPYIPLEQETGENSGSALDGTKRAKLLKEVRVRLGDVQPHAQHGHISLFREDVYGENVPRLTSKKQKRRSYM
ncbi:hypothetical protein BJ508DRAFT_320403 [Ascobolus immersus RN42]|uniref:Uncharacterized protein n=1 Tax=Ascobolus immersus RN42 TaxID=1160509 RepID=A0A3N4J338_ASCIM|nr:hypothetical protein BJ508DRAFT_320403 [Ascobolus immersus RN42]